MPDKSQQSNPQHKRINKRRGSKPRVANRPSATAVLVAVYAQLGIADVALIAEETGYSEAMIYRAMREQRAADSKIVERLSTIVESHSTIVESASTIVENPSTIVEPSCVRAGARKESSSKIVNSKKDSIGQIEFDRFWKSYPRKVSKKTAQKAFAKALKVASADEIIRAVEEQRGGLDRDQQFIPHAATWLNAERWTDPLPRADPPKSEFSRYMAKTNGHYQPSEDSDQVRKIKQKMGLL